MRPQETSGGGRRLLEHLLVALGLFLAVGYRFFEPVWNAEPGLLALGSMTAVAYLAACAASPRFAGGLARRVLLVTAVVSQPVLLGLWALGLPVSRFAVAGEMALLLLAIAAQGWGGRTSARVAAAVVFALVAGAPTIVGLLVPTPAVADGPVQHYVFSSYHDLSIVTQEVVAHETQSGGALAALPDGRVLLMTGSGASRVLDVGDALVASPIELGLPLDVAGYRSVERAEPEFYRAFDALYLEGRLFVSYTHWDRERDCFSLRLVEAQFDAEAVGPWATRFETQPCVSAPFVGNTSGGRIAWLDPAHLLLTVGSFWSEAKEAKVRSGMIIRLDLDTGQSEVFTTGHRNPEGLLVAGDRIWSTEHGPHGGDELNLISPGSDYGWPLVSYGTDYGKKTLSSGGTPGDHSGFTPPVYAWTPSIGVSNLIQVEDGAFPLWRGDLLVGSLSGLGNGHALFRVRLLDERVVSIERIPTGDLVRDLVQLPAGGPLLLWDGFGRISVVRPADHVFSGCSGCHNVRGSAHGIGPDLFGVVGSAVARHADFDYSAAMRREGGSWTPDRLDRFLQNPIAEIPGTSMEYEGVADPAERAEIIRFLSEISAGRRIE